MHADELICQYLIALDEGRSPCRTQWLRDHPEVAAELQQFFDDFDSVGDLLDDTHPAGSTLTQPTDRAALARLPALDSDANGQGEGLLFEGQPLEGHQQTSHSPETAARTLGRFELLECIGQGTSGSVWKAVDLKIGRRVAVKIPHGTASAGPARNQLLREARAAGRLRHPHVVRLHEVGETDHGIYIVSDLIDGPTLSQWLLERKPSVRQATELCLKMAGAIVHAHDAGVIHRDLKPANVLMDRMDQPQVTDFGLAKFDSGTQSMTLAGQIIGTPAYMAPEQARGDSHRVDARSDVYALGAIYFELLTGEKLFRGDMQHVLQQVLVTEPPNPASLQSHVTRDQATVCLKCLRKDPTRRYATARELAADLQRLLCGEPVRARPVGRWERALRWCRRQPYMAATVFLLAGLLLTLGVGGSLLAAREAQRQEQLIDAQIQSLLTAKIQAVPAIASGLQVVRDRAQVKLAQRLTQEPLPAAQELRVRLALLPADPAQAPWLEHRLLVASLEECLILREALKSYQMTIVEPYWKVLLERPVSSAQQRLAAAIGLAQFDPPKAHAGGTKWQRAADDVARLLVTASIRDPAHLRALASAVEPIRDVLREPLGAIFREHDRLSGQDGSLVAALLLVAFFRDQPIHLVELIAEADQRQFVALTGPLAETPVKTAQLLERMLGDPLDGSAVHRVENLSLTGRANLALALGRLGRMDAVWSLLQASDDPTVRSTLIERLIPWGIEPRRLLEHLGLEENAWVLQGVILSLGKMTRRPAEQTEEVRLLLSLYRNHPDADLFEPYRNNRVAQIWPVGRFRPNGLGLFDCHGNALEWCRTRYKPYASGGSEGPIEDWVRTYQKLHYSPRVLRGGNFSPSVVPCTSSQRAAFEPTRRHAAVGFRIARTLPLSVFETTNRSLPLPGKLERVTCLAAAPGGELIVSGESNGEIKFWSVVTGAQVKRFDGGPGPVRQVAVAADGKYCLTVTGSQGAALWSMPQGRRIQPFPGRTGHAVAGTFSADSRQILIFDSQGQASPEQASPEKASSMKAPSMKALLWDIKSKALVREYQLGAAVTVVRFLPEGDHFLTGGTDGVLRQWEQESGQCVQTMRGHTGPVHALAVSPDGRLALSGGEDSAVRLWELSSGKTLQIFKGHDGPVRAVLFAPDGKTGFSAGNGATIRTWDLETHLAKQVLNSHTGAVRALAITPAGKYLVSAGDDQTILRWSLLPSDR